MKQNLAPIGNHQQAALHLNNHDSLVNVEDYMEEQRAANNSDDGRFQGTADKLKLPENFYEGFDGIKKISYAIEISDASQSMDLAAVASSPDQQMTLQNKECIT